MLCEVGLRFLIRQALHGTLYGPVQIGLKLRRVNIAALQLVLTIRQYRIDGSLFQDFRAIFIQHLSDDLVHGIFIVLRL